MALKGFVPWNKGTKGKYSKKYLGKLRLAKLGKPTWNTGKEGYKAGVEHYNWKGGITKIDKLCRQLIEYKQWRSDIFQRDKWKCKTCGTYGGYITAHHIKGFNKIIIENNINSIMTARKCNEMWDINNGVTLCEPCHSLTDNYKGHAKSSGN